MIPGNPAIYGQTDYGATTYAQDLGSNAVLSGGAYAATTVSGVSA